MTQKQILLEHDGEWIRIGYRRARLIDWLPVMRLFLSICWRPCDGGGYLDARTAWQVAEGVHGIERGKRLS